MVSKIRSLLYRRYLLSARLYFGIGSAVFLTVAASLVGWFSFNRVGTAQNRVSEGSVPELVASFGVAQLSNSLIAAAPQLTTAETPEQLDEVSNQIANTRSALEEELEILKVGSGSENESLPQIEDHAATLVANIEAIGADRSELFELTKQSDALLAELTDLRIRLDSILVPAIDDQLFFTMTGYREIGETPAVRLVHLSGEEFTRYRHLAEILADGNTALQILSSAFSVANTASLEPLRERFESEAGHVERSLTAIEGSDLRPELDPIFERLFALGIGESSGFDLREQELNNITNQRDLLTRNQEIGIDLVAEVDVLVSAAQESVNEASRASEQAISFGRTLLLAISVLSIVGAILMAWLYVGRMLLRRIRMLSFWMLRMAGGDLEVKVDIGGRDEVTDMAAALEVFRENSLEAQRLNLVEKLAEELQEKNVQLETTLEDLSRAQDQIVAREKLASLGQLTAGVAHEVRNPLNFVKNFAEVSEELLEELEEVFEESGVEFDEEDSELIQEIMGDLTSNLQRILSHGNRADRIVNDMLMMGRGSSDWQLAKINRILEEYSRLAYHSARASDPNFQLRIEEDYDPNLGEVKVLPQDLSRVFLNIVGNACYATDEKRRSGATEADGSLYVPTVWLSTKRGTTTCQISIKDNGNGIPPEVVEKIFNPFFTTKPTGQGTGLGLAMCADIIQQHGGTISVNTEPGQFTEMVIELQLQPPGAEGEIPWLVGPKKES